VAVFFANLGPGSLVEWAGEFLVRPEPRFFAKVAENLPPGWRILTVEAAKIRGFASKTPMK
jgi:hypothetical protein